MPDWSYRTLSKPLLQRLPDDLGRRWVNAFLGAMATLPMGTKVVETLGHMAPPESLGIQLGGVALSSPLLLAPAIDPAGRAAKAFSKFGFGALVVGPVSLQDVSSPPRFARAAEHGQSSSGGAALSLRDCGRLLRRQASLKLFVEIDLSLDSPDFAQDCATFLSTLGPHAAAVILSAQSTPSWVAGQEANLRFFSEACRAAQVAPFLGVPDAGLSQAQLTLIGDLCSGHGLGVLASGHRGASQSWEWGGRFSETVALTASLRSQFPELELAVDGGVLEPAQGLALIEAGANAVLVSSGLVQTGPGLPKRLNLALLSFEKFQPSQPPSEKAPPPERSGWFWGAVLGLSMLFGAALAGWVALTDVMLPYDEEFCGKTSAEISSFNPKVLSFMTHDRFTLSGTMVSLGFLYLALSWFEVRRGSHWAQRAIQISATMGFLSFFAFLGYGYFDPFHAMVAAILFQMLVQIVVLPAGSAVREPRVPDLTNDRVWRLGLWGQLLFVVHGAALILAGGVILTYGMTVIFVPQDIEYLGMSSESLQLFDPQLRALIAHDRATFGGMLLSAGLALLFTTLWGFHKGDRWLWWTYLAVIATPYLQTLWIHRKIGYWNQFHLTPVYIGLVLLVLGLWCSRDYLLSRAQTS